ncbi:hypothetical protein ACIA74_07105 [Streptomyces sp. NPDC051658]|uniref:hypothetical protein n=1 Tax=Streptomyces sp. NPDC051658 TaxID=3365667 RepID=UPI0037AE0551
MTAISLWTSPADLLDTQSIKTGPRRVAVDFLGNQESRRHAAYPANSGAWRQP